MNYLIVIILFKYYIYIIIIMKYNNIFYTRPSYTIHQNFTLTTTVHIHFILMLYIRVFI